VKIILKINRTIAQGLIIPMRNGQSSNGSFQRFKSNPAIDAILDQ
jgi:hypothetical protein